MEAGQCEKALKILYMTNGDGSFAMVIRCFQLI
jgi:hypothetical protein